MRSILKIVTILGVLVALAGIGLREDRWIGDDIAVPVVFGAFLVAAVATVAQAIRRIARENARSRRGQGTVPATGREIRRS